MQYTLLIFAFLSTSLGDTFLLYFAFDRFNKFVCCGNIENNLFPRKTMNRIKNLCLPTHNIEHFFPLIITFHNMHSFRVLKRNKTSHETMFRVQNINFSFENLKLSFIGVHFENLRDIVRKSLFVNRFCLTSLSHDCWIACASKSRLPTKRFVLSKRF